MPTVVVTESGPSTGLPLEDEIGVALPKDEIDRLIAEEAERLRREEKEREGRERDVADELEDLGDNVKRKSGVPVWGWIVIAIVVLLILGAVMNAARRKKQTAVVR